MTYGLKNDLPDVAIKLTNPRGIYGETGSYSISPDETIRRIQQFFPKIGVTRVELVDLNITDNIPIIKINKTAPKPKCHRQASFWYSPPSSLSLPPRNCFGKGMTVTQSKASAMMEALERYCGQQFPHNRSLKANYNQVKKHALDPKAFNLPGLPIKCEGCPEQNVSCFQDMENVSCEWTWGYSLLHQRPILVPSAMVYHPYMSADHRSFMFNDTGGLSAGNTIEEAILQAIGEIIERDALYHVLNSGHLENLRYVDFRDSENVHLINFIKNTIPAEKVYSLLIWNNPMQLNVPTFATFVCYQIGEKRMFFGGSGTNLDPIMAISRALTELEQQKVRQNMPFRLDQDFLFAHNGDQQSEAIRLMDIPSQSTGFIGQDIKVYLDKLSKCSTDIIAVDLTHPEIGIPVVRVIIPGLIAYSGSDISESIFLKIMNAGDQKCSKGVDEGIISGNRH